jgi:hypothetical protein
MEPNLTGTFYKTPTGHESYELGFETGMIFPIATMLQKKYGFDPSFPLFGLDGSSLDLARKNPQDEAIDEKIMIGWDIWSDFFIMGLNEGGDNLIRLIAEFLEPKMPELEKMNEKMVQVEES